MASSCEDALRDASTQTDHVFPILDPNYLFPPNKELSVKMSALQEELDSLKHSLPNSPLQLMANSNQKTKFYTGYIHMKFHYLESQILSLRQKDVESETVCGDFDLAHRWRWLHSAVRRQCTRSEHCTASSRFQPLISELFTADSLHRNLSHWTSRIHHRQTKEQECNADRKSI